MAKRTAGAKRTSRGRAVVRSNGRTLHVDFENVVDSLVTARNAGVIFDYKTRARVLQDYGYDGNRCAFIESHAKDDITRIQLVRAYDAPPARENSVLEFVYRPAVDEPVTLRHWPLARCSTAGGAPGAFELKFLNDPVYAMDGAANLDKKDAPRPVALDLRVNGTRSKGTYSVDVTDRGGLTREVLKGLDQCAWIRFILHRHDTVVDLFAGAPGAERFVGAFDDIHPGGELYRILLGNSEQPRARGAGYWDCFRIGRPLKKGAKVRRGEPPVQHVGVTVPEPPARFRLTDEKQLLIDNWCLAETHNIRRTFHRPVKHQSNPLITCDKPWEPKALYLLGGVERQRNGLYRMWYCSFDPGDRHNFHTCLATSTDGVNWEKPDLGICKYRGSRRNNIVIMDAGTSNIFMNPDDPRPDFRYLASVWDSGRPGRQGATARPNGLHGWTSPDGLHWTDHGVIIPQSLDASTCHWDPVRKKYIAAVKLGYKSRRFRGYAESDDFLNWTDSALMADIDHLDVEGDQVYHFPIFRYQSVYLALCKIYHVSSTDTCDTHLAISHNCLHWQRPYRAISRAEFATKDNGEHTVIEYPDPHTQPFITTGSPGAWDFGNNDCPATAPVRDGDQLHFYYSGRYRSHSELNPVLKGWKGPKSTLGRATLRLDGFVSADADRSGGWVETKPLRLAGNQLFINANAKGGRLAVEVLDAKREPIHGFGAKDARIIHSDSVRTKCGWQKRKDLASLAGKTVRLRFVLSRASLYAFWCE